MTEMDIQAAVMIAVGSLPGVRLWRNNTGSAWQGEVIEQKRGQITLAWPRRIEFGLCVGSSDLIGHIGSRFLAMEVKTEDGATTPEQKRFLAHITAAGGLAGIVRSPDDAKRLIGKNNV